MSDPPAPPATGAGRVVICDYNALLHSVTGLLRTSGYQVFQAHDGEAAEELCAHLPGVDLLVLNTEGTGVGTPGLVRSIRTLHPGVAVLHIGTAPIPGMPADVAHLEETFTAAQLLAALEGIAHHLRDRLGISRAPCPSGAQLGERMQHAFASRVTLSGAIRRLLATSLAAGAISSSIRTGG